MALASNRGIAAMSVFINEGYYTAMLKLNLFILNLHAAKYDYRKT